MQEVEPVAGVVVGATVAEVASAVAAAPVAEFRGIGRFFCLARLKEVVPCGPLGGGTSPVPPVKSTCTLTPFGPQAPDVH